MNLKLFDLNAYDESYPLNLTWKHSVFCNIFTHVHGKLFHPSNGNISTNLIICGRVFELGTGAFLQPIQSQDDFEDNLFFLVMISHLNSNIK